MTLAELKEFFSTHPIPETLQLSEAEYISDLPKFLESHFYIASRRENVATFNSFLMRLNRVRELILEQEKNTAGQEEKKIETNGL